MRRRAAFTIVELLVAVFVIGILLSAIVALTSSFLGYSRRVSVINERLADLNDALGYMGTNARAAMDVVGHDATSVGVTWDGVSFTCTTTGTEPCLALVVPVVDRGTAGITGFDLLAYRFVALSGWADDPGLAEGWDGADTPLLLEYGASLCTGCTTPPAVPSSLTATRVSLVASDLTLDDTVGTFQPFTVAAAGTQITLRLRGRGAGSELGTFVPADGPLELTLTRRP
jgi:prepilin-type N-terminal cleavage/methylation domain-containing protein